MCVCLCVCVLFLMSRTVQEMHFLAALSLSEFHLLNKLQMKDFHASGAKKRGKKPSQLSFSLCLTAAVINHKRDTTDERHTATV